MIRILFLCHGDVRRSPIAEFIMKALVKKAGLEQNIQIESAATSTEETGSPVYPPARRKLPEHGIDRSGKMHLLMDFTDHPGEVADPWYTDDFDTTRRDVEEGCR